MLELTVAVVLRLSLRFDLSRMASRFADARTLLQTATEAVRNGTAWLMNAIRRGFRQIVQTP